MAPEVTTEIDMDFFSRRIGPYFTWLESKIESGWEQNDTVQKDVLKEVRYLATTMRARFILGLSRDDFTKEVARTVDLFELATEAFPGESDEVESKLKLFCKGISEELGKDYIPATYRSEPAPQAPAPKIEPVHKETKMHTDAPKIQNLPQVKPTPVVKPTITKPAPQMKQTPMPQPQTMPEKQKVAVEKKQVAQKPMMAVPTPKTVNALRAPQVIKQPKVLTSKKTATAKKPAKKSSRKRSRKEFILVRLVKKFLYG